MLKLLILADDFTGAFDTGIQFAARGANTKVVTDRNCDFSNFASTTDVVVLVTETRHMLPQNAYETVLEIVKKVKKVGIPYIYLKTDSALRGNVGCELLAVMDGLSINSIPFIPALPKLDRVTKEGIHYIEGVPVADSVFGKDPFEPVQESEVKKIIGLQIDKNIVLHTLVEPKEISEPGIQVYDAISENDLLNIGNTLGLENLKCSAGCSGFAKVLADLLAIKGEPPKIPKLEEKLFVVCGSVNPVTKSQIDFAEKNGFAHLNLTPKEKLAKDWCKSVEGKNFIKKCLADLTKNDGVILDVNDAENENQT